MTDLPNKPWFRIGEAATLEMLTVKEVAGIYRKTEKTIRRWLEAGEFPHAQKRGGGWFIPKADVECGGSHGMDK